MSKKVPFVLSIAGFDPSAGAGVLADVKTFEQHRVYGFAINTGNTIQTENKFFEMQWTDLAFVLKSLEKLFNNYTIKAVKIGIVPSLEYLKEIVFKIKAEGAMIERIRLQGLDRDVRGRQGHGRQHEKKRN